MSTRLIHFTMTNAPRQPEVAIYASALGRRGRRQVVRRPSRASATRLQRLLNRLVQQNPTSVDILLHLDGWSVVVRGRV